MGALPRPDLPPGPGRELVDALHGLHHRAGWPSLRTLARRVGCSHTTVSTVFSAPRLPTWGVLELLVESMGGDVASFHAMWLAASGPPGASNAIGIAGRRMELAVVGGHLEASTGMLLVSGEAGIGKTRLLSAAAAAASGRVLVATGSCLPLSTEVPMLPVADVLQRVWDVDGGVWLGRALESCPAYVAESLSRLLPELGPSPAVTAPDDDWSRRRLFAAVEAVLASLVALRPWAIVVEDLHWADAATLDFFEHLMTRGVELPVLATWRTDDPDIPAAVNAWSGRIRRLPTVNGIVLAPLSRAETEEQVLLLRAGPVDPRLVDRIYRRTRGLPLFTENLVAQADDGLPLPDLLADLLDERLTSLDEEAWGIARSLGVADRPLPHDLLSRATGLTEGIVTSGLHALDERRLLARDAPALVALRHPLLAEAIRRRLVPGEAAPVHARLAGALAATVDCSPAEVAAHWQEAGDAEEEIRWRISAARAAAERFGRESEAGHWQRVLHLWPDTDDLVGAPSLRLCDVYRSAFDALADVDVRQAAALIEDALRLVPDLPLIDQADLLRRAGSSRGVLGDPAEALAFADRAISAYESGPPTRGLVEALRMRAGTLRHLGRLHEASASVARGAEVATLLEEPGLRREMLGLQAWHAMASGERSAALAYIEEAAAIGPGILDPVGDVRQAVRHTDLLLIAGAAAADVLTAAAVGLEAAIAWDLDTSGVAVLRANVAEALTRDGRVAQASAVVDPVTEGDVSVDRWSIHARRAQLDALRGRTDRAAERFGALETQPDASAMNRLYLAVLRADADLWRGRPANAWRTLHAALEPILPTNAVALAGSAFVLLARAAADLSTDSDSGHARERYHELISLRARCSSDPFTASTGPADNAAAGATWRAELGRVKGRPTIEPWTEAIAEWDRLVRPHDAAYCRWRAAQAALTIGQGTHASKLLRRAARDAREHVPLSVAIAATTASTSPRT